MKYLQGEANIPTILSRSKETRTNGIYGTYYSTKAHAGLLVILWITGMLALLSSSHPTPYSTCLQFLGFPYSTSHSLITLLIWIHAPCSPLSCSFGHLSFNPLSWLSLSLPLALPYLFPLMAQCSQLGVFSLLLCLSALDSARFLWLISHNYK